MPRAETRIHFIGMNSRERDQFIRHRAPCVPGALLSVVLLGLVGAVSGQSAIETLEPGKSIERELAGGEVHSYRVVLDSGQYLRAVIDQLGIDVSVSIAGPDRRPLAEVDNSKETREAELLSLVANVTGEYQLEVRSVALRAPPGRYGLRITVLTATATESKSRLAADRLFSEGLRLRAQDTTETRRQAIEKYKEALSLWGGLADQDQQAEAICEIGWLYVELGEQRQALVYYEQALSLARATGDARLEARALDAMGQIFEFKGELQKTVECYVRALELERSAGDRNGQAQTLKNFGEFYFYVSDQPKAQEYLQQALPLRRALGDVRGEIEVLVDLGISYRALGEPQEALQYFNHALALPPLPPGTQAWILHSIGTIYYDLGEQEKALDSLGQAVQIREQLKSGSAAYTHNVIGNIYLSLGETGKALEHHERALREMRAMGDRQGEPPTLTLLGRAYARQGERQKAFEYFGQALPLLRGLNDRRDEAVTLASMADLYQSSGEWQKALAYFNQALAIQLAIGNRIGAAAALYGVARAERDLGQLAEARTRIETALESIETLRTQIGNHDLRASYLASKEQYYEFYIDLLMRMDARDPGKANAALALQANERARARSLLEILSEARTDIRQGVDPVLLERERTLQQQVNADSDRLARLLSGKHDEAQAMAAQKVVESRLTEQREVQAQIRLSSPRYAALTQPVPLSLKEIQTEVLDENTLLLEYSLGDEKSFLWAVTPSSITTFELPKRATIEAAARQVYESLTARGKSLPGETPAQKQSRIERADAQYPQAALALSRIVLSPVASELGKKRLLVVSEGALQYVPFAALPIPDGQESRIASLESKTSSNQTRDLKLETPDSRLRASRLPLIVDHEIVSLPSASVLAALRHEVTGRQTASKQLAVLADPVFAIDDPRIQGASKERAVPAQDQSISADVLRSAEESGLTGFERLRFSRAEADAIARLVPEDQRLEAVDFVANRATATSADLSRYRIVHFATHGLINSQHPELSGIVLSLVDEKGQQQDGFLRLYEIYNLKLNADLVVLSACQTALGKEIKGEGLIGLTRGFMYAGAPRVVASLWRIDDHATAELMKRFYRGMLGKQKLSAAAALRGAQLEMWKEKGWQNPYFWAFTLQGEWR